MAKTTFCAAACFMALSLVLVGAAPAAEPPEKEPGPAIVIEGGAPGEHAAEPASEYYIGVLAQPVDGTLRAQLKLPEGQGLVVAQVLPESPAAKAKLQQHDVLLRAGDKPLAAVTDLVSALEAGKDKKLRLEVIREGKKIEVEVTPVKRPAGMKLPPMPAAPPGVDLNVWRQWMEQNPAGGPGRPPMRFRVFQPGAVLPPATPLPGNISIAVSKQGDQPAKIHVERGDEKWDVAENELDKLPRDIRPHVERMLGQGAAGRVQVLPLPQGRPVEQAKPAPGVEKRLEEMNRQIQQLQKSVDELRKRLPDGKPEPKQ